MRSIIPDMGTNRGSGASNSPREKGQITILGVFVTLIFFLIAAALVDVYTLLEARNWGYQAAQQAALAGVSAGRDWSQGTVDVAEGCLGPGAIELDAAIARSTTIQVLASEMNGRGVMGYSHDVRVLPDHDGGSVEGYPPRPRRLGEGRGDWSAEEPSVGVYLTFPVSTFLMSAFVGRSSVQLKVFAAASVGQPVVGCP